MRITYKSILNKISAEVRESHRKGLEIKEIVVNQYEADQLRSECGSCSYLRFPMLEDMPNCRGCCAQKSECKYCRCSDRISFRVMDIPVRVEHIRY